MPFKMLCTAAAMAAAETSLEDQCDLPACTALAILRQAITQFGGQFGVSFLRLHASQLARSDRRFPGSARHVPPRAFSARVDLPSAVLERPEIVIPLQEQFRFLERAARRTGDPYFGARLGQVVRMKELSAFGAWVCAGENPASGIQESARRSFTHAADLDCLYLRAARPRPRIARSNFLHPRRTAAITTSFSASVTSSIRSVPMPDNAGAPMW